MKFASKKTPSEPVQELVQGQGLGVGKTARMLSQKSEHVLSIGKWMVVMLSCMHLPS